MRMSQLFSRTLREAPVEADTTNYQLLLRAGFIRQLSSGIFSYLPLGFRVKQKIEQIIREEMDAIHGQEVMMPVVHPAEIWKESGRWYKIGPELTRFEDRRDSDMVLAMTHEEVVADLLRKEINSYRQLPAMIYHIQTKWRDEPRPRAGLIRVREFTMKDSYSLDVDEEGLDKQYRDHYQAYFNIFHRCGLPVITVSSDTGMMGGHLAHEFMYLTPIGEDTLLLCDECNYAANREVATIRKPEPEAEEALPREKVHTPDTPTIEALAEFLDIPKSRTAKAVFMMGTFQEGDGDRQQFVFAVVRGDMELNEVKLSNAVNAKALRPATEDEIRAIGAEPGYGSPIGIQDAIIVVDDLVAASPNLVSGANEADYHYINVNHGRDFTAHVVQDIITAHEGDMCPVCEHTLHEQRGVEVGNIFKLGTHFSESLGASFLDEDGKARPVIMGSYGIGVDRLIACVSEHYNDENGLMLPVVVAPYQVHLVLLSGGEADATAEQLYQDLRTAGIEVLYDDRARERAGVKFNDADLIGLPIRLVVTKRSLEEGGVEYKRRDEDARRIIALDDVINFVQSDIQEMVAEIQQSVVDVPYKA